MERDSKVVKGSRKQRLQDLRLAQKAWKAHLKNPGKAVSARSYFAKRAK